ncbi:hypothetical protein [Aestuariivirga sp.]|uniref:hypothetical protein n=1 Tax=Aestuariivirga sp. TaxID=2650926 RepID=UPI0039E3755A
MNRIRSVAFALALLAPVTLAAAEAQAFCAVMQEKGDGKDTRTAMKHAANAVVKKIKALRKKHGTKLVTDEMSLDCLGGERTFTYKGRLTETNATCVAVQYYCVNR